MDEPSRELQDASPRSLPDSASVGSSVRDPRALSISRKLVALAVAIASDFVSVFAEFLPPLQIGVDLLTALALFAVLGFRWPLLPVLVLEAIPGVAAFPTWTLVVGVLAGATATKRSGQVDHPGR